MRARPPLFRKFSLRVQCDADAARQQPAHRNVVAGLRAWQHHAQGLKFAHDLPISRHPRVKEKIMSADDGFKLNRRDTIIRVSRGLAGIAFVCLGAGALAAKPKADREDFFYQDEPGEEGHSCTGCVNFSPKSSGKYGADSGDCALILGDVSKNGYCQGWTDKTSANARKAGT